MKPSRMGPPSPNRKQVKIRFNFWSREPQWVPNAVRETKSSGLLCHRREQQEECGEQCNHGRCIKGYAWAEVVP